MSHKRQGIVLLNMGSPASEDEVRAFLYRLFQDIDIFEFSGGRWFRTMFASLISTLRAPQVRQRYRALGGLSPLLAHTQKQALVLEQSLAEEGFDAPVEVGMRYSRPFISEAVRNLVNRGAEGIIGLPLYPQYCRSTTGSSLLALKESAEIICPDFSCRDIFHWCENSGYHTALARRIQASLNKFQSQEKVTLLFMAHSIPVRYVQKGDPYIDQVKITVEGVLQALKREGLDGIPWYLAYQSRVGPVKWVGPTVMEVLRTMMAKGLNRIIVVPISFVSDHLETLYEIDLHYKRLALELGVQRFERIESLNAGKDFIKTLAEQIVQSFGCSNE